MGGEDAPGALIWENTSKKQWRQPQKYLNISPRYSPCSDIIEIFSFTLKKGRFPCVSGSHPVFQHMVLTGCQVFLLLVRNKFPETIEMLDGSHLYLSLLSLHSDSFLLVSFTGY